MVATHLLMAAHGGGFAATTPVGTVVTTAPNGSTQPVSAASAYQYNGVIYVGYIDGSNGNVEIVTVDDTTKAVSAATVLHAALEADWHDTPAVLVRTDGKIVVAYSKHVGAEMYVRISTHAEDISAFGTETNIASQIGTDSGYTYPTLVQLTGESGSPVYLWYREHQDAGATGAWCLAKSTDGGATWATSLTVLKRTNFYAYANMDSDGTRLDIGTTDGSGSADHASIYHVYRVGTSYFKSDGTSAGSLPIDPTTLTQIFDGSATGVRYTASIYGNGGSPIVTFPDQTGNTDYYWAIWSGGSWHTHLVTDDGTTGAAWVEGGFVADRGDPTYSYLSRFASSHYNVWRYHTTDAGTTFDTTQLSTSPSDDFYPIAVRNAARTRVIWARGTASTYLSFSLGLLAAP